MKKANIYDVAKECGCSTTTVSKVLNGKGAISEEKKQQVLDAVKRLGFVPSNSAKNLATNKSQLIGVVLHDTEEKNITHELFSRILNSFRIVIERSGRDIVFLSQRNDSTFGTMLQRATARTIEGVFFLCADYSDEEIKELVHSSIPSVAFDGDNCPLSVETNNEESIALMVDYLVSMGHQRIAFVDTKEAFVSHKRLNGFKMGLERNHIKFDPRMVQEGTYCMEGSTDKIIDRVIASGYNPTVIMMPDDYSGLEGIKSLQKHGLRCPEDISLVGFDGIDLVKYSNPTLTTIGQDTKELGRNAALALLDQIENNNPIKDPLIKINAKIIEGQSVKKIS